ncbi:hypothetical protein DYB26_002061 [Aphanomyces astaci]|nr:hypothetical protein DYB26_002061 [Aphanomyces astaci]
MHARLRESVEWGPSLNKSEGSNLSTSFLTSVNPLRRTMVKWFRRLVCEYRAGLAKQGTKKFLAQKTGTAKVFFTAWSNTSAFQQYVDQFSSEKASSSGGSSSSLRNDRDDSDDDIDNEDDEPASLGLDAIHVPLRPAGHDVMLSFFQQTSAADEAATPSSQPRLTVSTANLSHYEIAFPTLTSDALGASRRPKLPYEVPEVACKKSRKPNSTVVEWLDNWLHGGKLAKSPPAIFHRAKTIGSHLSPRLNFHRTKTNPDVPDHPWLHTACVPECMANVANCTRVLDDLWATNAKKPSLALEQAYVELIHTLGACRKTSHRHDLEAVWETCLGASPLGGIFNQLGHWRPFSWLIKTWMDHGDVALAVTWLAQIQSGTVKLRPRREMHDRFGELFERGIRLTLLADCATCGHRLSEADLQTTFRSTCPSCQGSLSPFFCVRCMDQPPSSPIPYFSWSYLHARMTAHDDGGGKTSWPLRQWHAKDPHVYWNIVVKCLSLDCPFDSFLVDLNEDEGAVEPAAPETTTSADIHRLCQYVLGLPSSATDSKLAPTQALARRLLRVRIYIFYCEIVMECSSLGRHKWRDDRVESVATTDATMPSQVCFCRLDHGYLRFYTSADMACLVSELRLSGCKVDVKPHKRVDNIPFSFTVESQRVLVKDRTYALSPKTVVEVSGLGPSVRSEWARAISTWQRHYFKDEEPKTALDHERERERLEEALLVFRKVATDTPRAAVPPPTPSSILGIRLPSLRKSIIGVLEVLTSRARVSESTTFNTAQPHPVATA